MSIADPSTYFYRGRVVHGENFVSMASPRRCPLCETWCVSWLARALHLVACHGWVRSW